MPGQIVGYARVSSTSQNLARQLEALGAVDELFTDHQSGKSRADRAGLSDALRYVRRGDTLRVASMDRLARSLIDLEQIVSVRQGTPHLHTRCYGRPVRDVPAPTHRRRRRTQALPHPRTPTRRNRPGQSTRRVQGSRPPPQRRTDRPCAPSSSRRREQGQARDRPWGLAPPHLRRHRRQRLRSSDRPCP